MKRRIWFFFFLALLVAGCGGGGTSTIGDVSGFIEDINGNPVRDARVFVDGGPETRSNSAGSYVLVGVPGDVRTIKASTTQDGVSYYGENVVQLFNGERSKTVNITVVQANQRATLTGTVRDRNGFLVEGAHVFAAAQDGQGHQTVSSGTMVLTDANGRFRISTLIGGVDHAIVASARGFNSDTETVNVPAGQSLDQDFTLSNPTDPNLPAPANVEGVAWTTPFEASTRAANQRAGLEAIKNMLEPKRRTWRHTRDTSGGNFVEIDLDWTQQGDPSLLGFDIYRAPGNVSSGLSFVDFYRDPLGTLYEDADSSFTENQTYTYGVAAVNTEEHESPLSNLVVLTTLGDENLNPVTAGPTFHWQAVSGADTYKVFVFDRFPSLGVISIWNGTTSGTSLAYGGPALTSGNTYYYVVLAEGNSATSRSISIIDSFVAP